MNKKIRIAVLGIGGVGGFIGGKLAAAYSGSTDIDVIFIARGDNEQVIKSEGLKLLTGDAELTVRPTLVTHDAHAIGHIDLLLCCTKTYSFDKAIRSVASCIDAQTIILPLANGVDNTERIRAIVPEAQVLQGCIYIAARQMAPGVVKQNGNFYAVHFGGAATQAAQITLIDELLKGAGINAVAEAQITERVWAKFAFVSPLATYTTAKNISFGGILEQPEHTGALKQLMQEVLQLAEQKGIKLPEDSIRKNLEAMTKLPPETTSSMHADFQLQGQTELETLTGFVVKEARQMNVPAACYDVFYQELLLKAAGTGSVH